MAIAFNGSYGANSTTRDGSSLSVTFTPVVGERIVVKLAVETGGLQRNLPTSTGGLTWTQKVAADFGSSYSACYLWESSAITSATPLTVTCHGTGGSARVMSMLAERWSGGQVSASSYTGSGASTLPNGSLTANAGSYISTVIADYNSGDTSSRAYLSGATEEWIATALQSYYLTAYHTYQNVGTTGTQTVGMSSPTQKWTMLSVEMGPPINAAPTANAGTNQIKIEPWSTVTLNGSGSDSDGNIASYSWTQTAGPVVVLSSSSSATPTFEAPGVLGGVNLTFSLTATDNGGATSSASTVTVAVLPPTTYYANGSSWSPMKISQL